MHIADMLGGMSAVPSTRALRSEANGIFTVKPRHSETLIPFCSHLIVERPPIA